ncbi:MAG: GNAT family N-acetyltransferase [Candidatus Gracilibacteria bacterium]|nr:GNAT family N-acetyltransferase [Candidatus Gracilibacteria bacterium]
MLKLEFPNKSHKQAYEKLIKEWGNGYKAPQTLFYGKTFEEFLGNVIKEIDGLEGFVPAHLFFLIDDEIKNEIIGAIQIRHNINHPNLIEDGGHIGYGINPKYRKKGYGKIMLSLALEKIKELGLDIDKISITCDIANIGSNKIIQSNGGIFDKKVKDETKNRYWINL